MISKNFDLSFVTLQWGFLYIVEFKLSQILKTKAVKDICIKEKVIIWLIFNLGLASIYFRITWLCLQQVNLIWAHDPITSTWSAVHLKKSMSLGWALNLSLQYDDVILCIGRCHLTTTWMSSIKEGCHKPRLPMSLLTYGCNLLWFRVQAIPLVMITTRKSILRFPLLSYMGSIQGY